MFIANPAVRDSRPRHLPIQIGCRANVLLYEYSL